MKNFIQPGETITLPAPYTVASGDGMLIGVIFGVANSDAVLGNNADLTTEGVFTLPKASVSITLGAKLYWDDAARKVTTTSAGNLYIGAAVEAAATVALTVAVRLHGAAV
jgi:predicted RecA/RadA family phage recombinase